MGKADEAEESAQKALPEIERKISARLRTACSLVSIECIAVHCMAPFDIPDG